MFKRVLSLILILVTLATFVPFSTFADAEDNHSSHTKEVVQLQPSSISQYKNDEDDSEQYKIYDGVRKTVTLNGDGKNAVCVFIPTYSDTYIFTSYASGDTIGAIYDDTATQLAYNDDGGEGYNFKISYYMTAGTGYILATCYYSSSTSGSYEIEIYGTHEHEWDPATCSKPQTCSICGITNGDPLEHIYYDDCDVDCDRCGEERTPPHVWTNVCDPDCNMCGETRTPPHAYITVSCTTEQICSICGQAGEIPGHIYDNITCDTDCNFCGDIRTVPHVWDNICDTECNLCKATRTVPHVWTNDCDTECNLCKFTREITHKFVGATCTEKGTCSVCGAVGTALGHTYTNVCDTDCNRCKAVRTAPHKYTTVTKKATTTAPGYVSKQCALCKKVYSKTTLFAASKVSINTATFAYNGKVQRPKVTVLDSQGKAISATNYTITYSSGCKKAGTYQAVVTFKGNYAGSKTFTFTIKPLSASKVTVKPSKTSFAYNGKAQTPTLTVKDAYGNTLKNKTDYTVSYSSGRKKVGTYKITLKFKGNYSGAKTLSYTIKPAPASKVTVTLNKAEFAYNGKAQTPKLVLKDSSGNTLKNKTDYTISYPAGRKKVGNYKITITFKGNYSGKKAVTYTIAPTLKTAFSGYIGDTFKIGAKSNAKISYSSSNQKVATVNPKGVVTAVGKGKATIVVKSAKVSREITITVTKPSIRITAPRTSMYIGETVKFSATTNPAGAKVSWSVNNKKLATINAKGVLTAKGKGTVTVTGKFTYKDKTYKSTFKVNIDVEYPDISVFISSQISYTNSYAFIIENKSSRPLTVINRGSVYCGGDSANVDTLFAGSGYCNRATVNPGKSEAMVLCLDRKMVFLKSKTTYAYIYIEYGGETFQLSCNTSRSGLNKCSTITWMRKS